MKIKPIYNKKIMSKELSQKELTKIIREALLKNPDLLKEFDEEDLGIYTDFDSNEMHGDALRAAMADIAASGDEFVPLGKSKFEKGMNPDEFTANIQRAKLDLPKDKEELSKIKKGMDTKLSHEKKFGVGSMNEDGPLRDTFDTTSLYKFLKDAMFSFMEGDGSMLNYAEAAQFLEEELIKNFDITKKNKVNFSLNQEGENSNVNPDSKIDRPKDAEGQPLTHRARVEDLETGTIGHVIRFGVDDNSNQTVHVEWMYTFGDAIVKPITYPNKIVVRDDTRIVREEEKVSVENELEKRFAKVQELINYLIYKKDIGQASKGEETRLDNLNDELDSLVNDAGITFDFEYAEQYIRALEKARKNPDYLSWSKNAEADFNAGFNDDLDESSIRSHANGRGQNIKPGNFPRNLKRVGMNENYDFAAAEREHAGQEELASLANQANQVVPESLIQYLEPNSFSSNESEYSYLLKIPKQPNEMLKDIELFVKEELGIDKQVNLYTELEKITNKWVVSVKVLK